MSAPLRVLVVATRRIGDVLLATPLIASAHAAWPQARIDALVFSGTGGVLSMHPGVARVIEVDERPGLRAHAGLLARIAGRYDLALSVVPGDRPTLYARLAARRAVGLVVPGAKHRWKRWLLEPAIEFDDLDTHTVIQNLRVADALGIARVPKVHVPRAPLPEEIDAALRCSRWAVIHAWPRFRYKLWPADAQVALAYWLATQGLRPVLSGGPDAEERAYVAALAARMPPGTLDLSGRLSLAQLGTLIARATLYVGPDTVATHMAAATGVPTLALFGPSNPVKWGPWPADWNDDHGPWARTGSARHANVFLVQGEADCAPGVPCLAEGCDRHIHSTSRCLDTLAPARVIAAARELLGVPPTA